MDYTVQELAKLSGVSIRTLRYYDEIGLLKPAFVGDNKYRYYQEKQLLLLQQILFFKELGFELKQIQKIVGRADFDTLNALRIHAQKVQERITRLHELLETVYKTINHLEGNHTMKDTEMYHGFDSEKHQQSVKELDSYFEKQPKAINDTFKRHKKEVEENTKNWTPEQWAKSHETFHIICTKLAALLRQNASPNDAAVQALIAEYFKWLSNFWTATKESYTVHTIFLKNSDLKDACNKHHPDLAEFLVKAIHYFADHAL